MNGRHHLFYCCCPFVFWYRVLLCSLCWPHTCGNPPDSAPSAGTTAVCHHTQNHLSILYYTNYTYYYLFYMYNAAPGLSLMCCMSEKLHAFLVTNSLPQWGSLIGALIPCPLLKLWDSCSDPICNYKLLTSGMDKNNGEFNYYLWIKGKIIVL